MNLSRSVTRWGWLKSGSDMERRHQAFLWPELYTSPPNQASSLPPHARTALQTVVLMAAGAQAGVERASNGPRRWCEAQLLRRGTTQEGTSGTRDCLGTLSATFSMPVIRRAWMACTATRRRKCTGRRRRRRPELARPTTAPRRRTARCPAAARGRRPRRLCRG